LLDVRGKWRQLGSLTGWQWYVLLASPLVLLLTWVRLRSGGYGKTLAWLRQGGKSVPETAPVPGLARDTAYALAVSIKYGPWRPKCLVRSMALGRFLGRKGIPFELKIGVPAGQPVNGVGGTPDFNAHAWVEYGGVVLNDKADIANEFSAFEEPGRRGFSRVQKKDMTKGNRG
jgi:hypothetical protein